MTLGLPRPPRGRSAKAAAADSDAGAPQNGSNPAQAGESTETETGHPEQNGSTDNGVGSQNGSSSPNSATDQNGTSADQNGSVHLNGGVELNGSVDQNGGVDQNGSADPSGGADPNGGADQNGQSAHPESNGRVETNGAREHNGQFAKATQDNGLAPEGAGFAVHERFDRSAANPTDDDRLLRLEERVERLSAICEAMWDVVSDAVGLDLDQLTDRLADIDPAQALIDETEFHDDTVCPNCGNAKPADESLCLFCSAGTR